LFLCFVMSVFDSFFSGTMEKINYSSNLRHRLHRLFWQK